MSDAIGVLNAGSSNLKYSVYTAPGRPGTDAALEPIAHGQLDGGETRTALDAIRGAVPRGSRLAALGHRVVHGGRRFEGPVRIDASVLREIERLEPLAPLHQPQAVAAIRAVSAADPTLVQVACFDTAFHRTESELAQAFALPRTYREEGVHRYGFHGLSYESIAAALPRIAPEIAAARVVVAHLGNGASLCAMARGRSVATTMGFSALDGLVMGTRSGALDPGALLFLMRQHALGAAELEELLYHRSGLLGVSGLSSDMRVLLASDDPRAREAVELFVYRIGRELGSMAAALGGLDALVFTGGIGENAAEIRARVCQGAGWLGVRLDAGANGRGGPRISEPGAAASAWVIGSDENEVIARHSRALLRARP